jgi:hypothetical protein
MIEKGVPEQEALKALLRVPPFYHREKLHLELPGL